MGVFLWVSFPIDLDHLSLLPAKRHLIAHDFVFHRVLQRGIEQHLHHLTLHEAHLNDALPESTTAHHLYDDSLFACLQF